MLGSAAVQPSRVSKHAKHRLPELQLRGRLDKVAGKRLDAGNDLFFVARPAAQQQRHLVGAGVAVALQIVRGDRSATRPMSTKF
jgi:hypothetical protein